jgi:hypothetical protein
MHGEMRKAHSFFVKPEGTRPLRRKDNMTMDLREIALEGVDWIHLAQDMD